MIQDKHIKKYLMSIPPLPETLKNAIRAVDDGDMRAAAKHTAGDPALTHYLRELVQKPYFGFAHDVKDVHQIFGAMGLIMARQVLHAYMLSMILPRKWSIFDFDMTQFQNLQAESIKTWEKVLTHQGVENADAAMAAVLLPATIIVCERLFSERKRDVLLFRETKNLSFHEILKRLTGMGLYDLAMLIGKKWELKGVTLKLTLLASGESELKKVSDKELHLARLLHLSFFYILSRPPYMKAGLNEFVNLNMEFISPVAEDFNALMEPVA